MGNPLPVNDLCANAIEIDCGDTRTGNIAAATNNDAPGTCNLGSSQGVWYHFTGTGDYINLSTCNGGTDYNAQLEIYKGDCNSLECVAAEDSDVGCSSYFHASVGFCSEEDVDYFIYVSVSFGSPGNFELTASCQPEPPQVEIEARGGSLILCDGSNVELHASQGAASYSWSPGGQTGPSVNVTEAGTYTVTGEYNGCSSSATITVDSMEVEIEVFNDTVCEGADLLEMEVIGPFSGSFSGTGLLTSGSVTFSAAGVPTSIPDNSPSGVSLDITPTNAPGTEVGSDVNIGSVCVEVNHEWQGDLIITLTSPDGTEVTLYDRPGVPESPSGCSLDNFYFTFVPGTGNDAENFCNNDASGVFTAHGGDDIADLEDGSDPNGTWTLHVADEGDQNTGTIESFSITYTTSVFFDPAAAGPGNHVITYEIESCASNNCGATTTKTITVVEGPTFIISGGDTVCQGDSVQINFDMTGIPPWNITYTDGIDTFGIGPTSNASGFINVATSGTYLPISVTDASGCPGAVSGSAIAAFHSVPSVSFTPGNHVLCDSLTLPLNVTGGTPFYTYSWDPSGEVDPGSHQVFSAGTFCVTVTDVNQCKDTACITVLPGNDEPEACVGMVNTSNAPTVGFSGTALGVVNDWTWDFGDGNSGTGQNAMHTYTSNGPKIVTMTATNECGSCTHTFTIVIVSVGIDEDIGIENLEIYPNPTNESVTVAYRTLSDENIGLLLNNEMGQLVYEEKLAESAGEYIKVIDVNHLANGIYTLQIITSKGIATRKIVKQ